ALPISGGAFLQEPEAPLRHRDLQTGGREGTHEHHGLGGLGDVDETAGAGETGAELADVQVSVAVRLGEAQEGKIEASAIIEIELGGLVDHGGAIRAGSEAHSCGGNAANDARFRGKG